MRRLLDRLRSGAVAVLLRVESVILVAARPVNAVLAAVYRRAAVPGSVLHISAMVHIPWLACEVLRANGVKADFMALGSSPHWNTCDYHVDYSRWPPIRAFQQLTWFWGVVARYEIVHFHFMMTLGPTGWELPLLKRMGRGIVVHFRGCEVRDRELNMRLHPDMNICEECDYWFADRQIYSCQQPELQIRRHWAREYGDAVLVTTPDMKDFWPEAIHFPFFAPELPPVGSDRVTRSHQDGVVKIVHATNHPGIEGSRHIAAVVESLQEKGHRIELCFLKGVGHERVLEELRDADLSIGKMKMGYYANAQIESMMLGVPTFTYVREEFITPELRESGFVLCSLDDLGPTLEHCLLHHEDLERKAAQARSSIERLHDNTQLAQRLIAIYSAVLEGKRDSAPSVERPLGAEEG